MAVPESDRTTDNAAALARVATGRGRAWPGAEDLLTDAGGPGLAVLHMGCRRCADSATQTLRIPPAGGVDPAVDPATLPAGISSRWGVMIGVQTLRMIYRSPPGGTLQIIKKGIFPGYTLYF